MFIELKFRVLFVLPGFVGTERIIFAPFAALDEGFVCALRLYKLRVCKDLESNSEIYETYTPKRSMRKRPKTVGRKTRRKKKYLILKYFFKEQNIIRLLCV